MPTRNFRFCMLGRVAYGLLVLTVAAVLNAGAEVPTAVAGSPLGELQYRYPCEIGKERAEFQYSERYPATVGVSLDFGPLPALVINERLAFEQPFEVVAFEYFAACEQARRLMHERDPERRRLMRLPEAEKFLSETDCSALYFIRREGVVRGHEGYSTIIEVYRFWRAKEVYFDVPFDLRAENIQRNCPI